MAEQMDKELICAVKKEYPDYKVVAYINTTADLKTVCDVCVTSSSAVKIIKIWTRKTYCLFPTAISDIMSASRFPKRTSSSCTAAAPFTPP